MKRQKKDLPRVLCAEDHPALCQALAELLQDSLPARVEAVQCGGAVFDMLLESVRNQDPFRLLLLDMQMPREARGMIDRECGLKLLGGLFQSQHYPLIKSGTPVIFYVQEPRCDHAVKCMRAGAYDYVPKGRADDEENTQRLVQLCKDALEDPPSPPASAILQWLDRHSRGLARKHVGQFAGLVDAKTAKEAGIEEEPLDGIVTLIGNSYQAVQKKILRNPILRWEQPPIFNLPNPEEYRV